VEFGIQSRSVRFIWKLLIGFCDFGFDWFNLVSLTSAELVDVVKGEFLLNTRDVCLVLNGLSITRAEPCSRIKGWVFLDTHLGF
jgi:hypothetical protein